MTKPKIEYEKHFSAQHGSVDKAFIPFEISDRKAKCMFCVRISKSDPSLPYFESRSQDTMDEYYCGCRGWD